MTLTQYIKSWMETYKRFEVKQASYDRLITSVNALKGTEIAKMQIEDITQDDVQRYVNGLVTRGYGMSTIKKQMRIVTAPLNHAAARRIIPASPCIGIKLPARSNVKKETREILPYSDAEQTDLLRVTAQESHPAYRAIELMLETGLRAGEALALRWRDVDINRKRLSVHATVIRLANQRIASVQNEAKSRSSNRVIPLTPRAIDILQSMEHDSEWVFSVEGERLSYETLRYKTQRACKMAQIPYRGQHVFRHTFATNCYYRGVDIKVLSRLLGHADTSITYNIYVSLYGDGFTEMYNALIMH